MALDGEAWDIVLADYLLSGFGGLGVSLGVATVEDGRRLIDAWKLADMHMYEDKLLKGSRRTGKQQAKEKHMNK